MNKEAKKRAIVIGVFACLGIASFFFDSRIAEFFRIIKNPFLDYLFMAFKPISMILLFFALIIVLLARAHRRKWILPLGTSVLVAILVSFALKFIFMRERPFGLEDTIDFTNIKDYSFPSTHASAAFAALPLLDRELPKLKYAWIILSILVALSRLYFGVHYLSDVIFGSILGYLVGFYVFKITDKKLGKKKS